MKEKYCNMGFCGQMEGFINVAMLWVPVCLSVLCCAVMSRVMCRLPHCPTAKSPGVNHGALSSLTLVASFYLVPHSGSALGKLHWRWVWAAPLNPYEGGEEPLQRNRG